MIKIDLDQLDATTKRIDDYVKFLKAEMKKADNMIEQDLNVAWSGADYKQYNMEWKKINQKDSDFSKMVKSLEKYADFLRVTAREYRSAQSNALNRANSLPKW